MNPIALYFASGESLYLGTALLVLVMLTSFFLTTSWLSRVRNATAWVALALIVMACPPFALWVDLGFLGVFVLWFATSNQLFGARTSMKLQRGATIVPVLFLTVLTSIEFSHRKMPTVKQQGSDHLVVIGDSISAGIDSHVPAWPLVFQQRYGMTVRNLARPGAQVRDGLAMADTLTPYDRVVLIELGGNDLLMGVSSEQYGKDLDVLLLKVTALNRTVIMFELPLLPNKIAYGRIQRRLAAKYRVMLIPKRCFAQVIGGTNATTDGLHLSPSGSTRMAALVAEVLSPILKSSQQRSEPYLDRT